MQYEFFKPSRKILLQRFKIRQSEDSLRVFREEGRVVKLDIRLSRIHFAALSCYTKPVSVSADSFMAALCHPGNAFG